MKKIISLIKKNLMLSLSIMAAACSLLITPPSARLFKSIDWRTLANLTMMLNVLQGFKKENIFDPIVTACCKLKSVAAIAFAMVFGVFFSSMFVTNDVSLIIFVPLTISIFRSLEKENLILPTITMENIAAVRGSLLTPFGSPQNLFLFGKSNISAFEFIKGMAPLCTLSAMLLAAFILAILHRKSNTPCENAEQTEGSDIAKELNAQELVAHEDSRFGWRKTSYVILLAIAIASITSRTKYWPYVLVFILLSVLVIDRRNLMKIDWSLLAVFLCFFIFSSSIAGNQKLASFLIRSVAGNEYWWSIALSQVVSNVPAAIILHPFSYNMARLIYGLDSAGLVSIIGSLASVINYRLYVREFPGNGKAFLKTFTLISLAFFAIVVIPGYLLSANDFLTR